MREAARTHDFDRYLAALLAPPAARADLIVIAAFAGELARIPHVVREPMMGEIRLQWWRDAIAGFATGAATGHPVADALGELARRRKLPREELLAAVDAREADLYADPFADEAALDRYLAGCEGTFFALDAAVLGGGGAPNEAARAARGKGLRPDAASRRPAPPSGARPRAAARCPGCSRRAFLQRLLPSGRPSEVRAVLARAVARARADLSSRGSC